MTILAPGTVVDAPPLRPPVVGLLQAAQVVNHEAEDSRWFAGLRWRPSSNVALEGEVICASPQTLGEDRPGTANDDTEAFVLVAHDTCSAFGFTEANYEERARELLAAKEWSGVEAEFERGALVPGNARLANTGATFPAGGAVGTTPTLTPKDALALLDEAIAEAAIGQGMIHAPHYVIAQWVGSQVVKMDDVADSAQEMPQRRPALFSPNGNVIVAGSGYLGAAPDGSQTVDATHGVMWAYATDLVVVHREATPNVLPGSLAEATDRALNNVTFRAWRAYAIEWSQLLHAAVKVSTAFATP